MISLGHSLAGIEGAELMMTADSEKLTPELQKDLTDFDSGLNPDKIRRIAGHENIEMTMKRCRGRKSPEELEKVLEQSLST